MNGKGSKPRNCFSKNFKNNYDKIEWQKHPSDNKIKNEKRKPS